MLRMAKASLSEYTASKSAYRQAILLGVVPSKASSSTPKRCYLSGRRPINCQFNFYRRRAENNALDDADIRHKRPSMTFCCRRRRFRRAASVPSNKSRSRFLEATASVRRRFIRGGGETKW